MATKIMFANKKGGVGKTTSSVNVSALLAEKGYRVLAMDFDSQSHLTKSVGINYDNLKNSLSEVFLGKCTLANAITELSDNLHILPSRPDLVEVPHMSGVVDHMNKNNIIKFKIGEVESRYDFIIMDTPPSVTDLLVTNCFAIASHVIIPIQPRALSLDGLKQFLGIIANVREQWVNPDIHILGLLITFAKKNSPIDATEQIALLREGIGGKVKIFDSMIRDSTALSAAPGKGRPITLYRRKSIGFEDYENLTAEILRHVAAHV